MIDINTGPGFYEYFTVIISIIVYDNDCKSDHLQTFRKEARIKYYLLIFSPQQGSDSQLHFTHE